jgi:hypothetical protein
VVGGEPEMRLLLIIAVILVLTLVLFGAGALDDVANVIIQILRVVFDLLVRLINLFVNLLKSIG